MWEKLSKLNAYLNKRENGAIYLFGASVTGKKALDIMTHKYNLQVTAFIDNNPEKQGQNFEDIEVISIEKLKEIIHENDIVIITSGSGRASQIKEQLVENNIKNYFKFDESFFHYAYQYEELKNVTSKPSWEKAVQWLLNHITKEGGIAYGVVEKRPYPEVTGYLIPTLLKYGYQEEAQNAVKWLISIQQEDGGFRGISGEREYIFDTAQILRGFYAFLQYGQGLENNIVLTAIRKACEYLYNSMIKDGEKGYQLEYEKDEYIPETILLYTLTPLKKAAIYLERKDYLVAVDNTLDFYLQQERLLDKKDLTHFTAYQIEALIDLGKQELVKDSLNYYKKELETKGYIPAKEGGEWTCIPGMAQLAKCWYKLGENEPADQIMDWLETNQLESGGFFGSDGEGAAYFPHEELSWVVKYYLDANYLRIHRHFNAVANDSVVYPEEIDLEDARYQFISDYVKNGMHIAEIGCGKGRFLKGLQKQFNELTLAGVDIAEEMLAYVPGAIEKVVGRLENIPLEDRTYDIVFSVEAIEHSINKEKAIQEMARILKTNGRLLIVDKNKQHWGRLNCPAWESWLDINEIEQAMKRFCVEVEHKILHMKGHEKEDDYMVGWIGKKA